MALRLTLAVVLTLLTACTPRAIAERALSARTSQLRRARPQLHRLLNPLTPPALLMGRFSAGEPIAKSTVTLYSATSDSPEIIGHRRRPATTGKFTMVLPPALGSLSGNGRRRACRGEDYRQQPRYRPDLRVGRTTSPPHVVVNEFTTVASVWTLTQFLSGTAIKGYPFLGLRIAAGNVPNFVDLETGGWGGAIQDPLNSGQTPTMANFATLADALAGCATRVVEDACASLSRPPRRPKAARRPTR